MKSRLGPIGIALVMMTAFVALVPVPVVAVDTTSTTGVRIISVPSGANTIGVAMQGDAIALNPITGILPDQFVTLKAPSGSSSQCP
jgi:hypothetical protein